VPNLDDPITTGMRIPAPAPAAEQPCAPTQPAPSSAAVLANSQTLRAALEEPVPQTPQFNCLVAGVGGQGAVLASRLIAAAAMDQGAFVRTAETIGMSQRGGSVTSHVRVGATARDLPSSLIPPRAAQLVLAFEPGEAVRAFKFLAPGGALVCATRPVVPSAAATSGYDGQAQLKWLAAQLDRRSFVAVDTAVLEREGLSPKCANVLLLGAAVGLGALPFGAPELRAAMRQLMKPKLIDMNDQALALGLQLAAR